MKFGDNRGWIDLCNWKINNCKLHYTRVYSTLKNMKIQSYKMRWWDHATALPTDLFRFWFIDKKEFEKRVLSQTLIPHIKEERL